MVFFFLPARCTQRTGHKIVYNTSVYLPVHLHLSWAHCDYVPYHLICTYHEHIVTMYLIIWSALIMSTMWQCTPIYNYRLCICTFIYVPYPEFLLLSPTPHPLAPAGGLGQTPSWGWRRRDSRHSTSLHLAARDKCGSDRNWACPWFWGGKPRACKRKEETPFFLFIFSMAFRSGELAFIPKASTQFRYHVIVTWLYTPRIPPFNKASLDGEVEDAVGATSSLVPALTLEEAFGKPVDRISCLVLLLYYMPSNSDILVKLHCPAPHKKC